MAAQTVRILKTRWGAHIAGGSGVYTYDDHVIAEDATSITCRYSGSKDASMDQDIVAGAHFMAHNNPHAHMQYVGIVVDVQRIREWTSRESPALYILTVHKSQQPVQQFHVPPFETGCGKTRWWTDAFARYFGMDLNHVRRNLPVGIVKVHCGGDRLAFAKGRNVFWVPEVHVPLMMV